MHVDIPWFITHHALMRMREMGLGRRDVVDVLENAELDYPSRQPWHPQCRTAVGRALVVAYDPDVRAVITVMPRACGAIRPPLPPRRVLLQASLTTGVHSVQ